MNIKAVLFDLDGTLLPMDFDVFLKAYFGGLCKKMVPFGYEPDQLVKAIWKGTDAMIKNDGSATNEEAFKNCFKGIYGEEALGHIPYFDEFYKTDFKEVQKVCGFTPDAKKTVDFLKSRGLRLVLATSPIFPLVAIEARLSWAGLSPSDFEFVTTYENSCYTKPNPKYYEGIAERLGLDPAECIMVGNDVDDDMVASDVGMKVFLLTDNLINKSGEDIEKYPHGGYGEMLDFLTKAISEA